MKSSENFRLEERVLFEAGAAIEAAAADQAAQDAAASAAEAAEASENAEAADSEAWKGVEASGAANENPAEFEDLSEAPGEDSTGVIAFTDAPVAADFSSDDIVNTPADRQECKELVVINSSVADSAKIVNDLDANFEILRLEAGTDALDVINDYLDEHADTKYSAIHIVSHGNDGYFTLNGEKIDSATLNPADWKAIGEHLTDGADILVYGCDTAKSEEGKALVHQISSLTGADVAASTDTTGANGNWDLEYQAGLIESATLQPAEYTGRLAGSNVTVTIDGENDFAELKDAIAEAAGGGTITFTVDTAKLAAANMDTDGENGNDSYGITIDETLVITGNITIDGWVDLDGDNTFDEGERIVFDGAGARQIMTGSTANVALTLKNLTFQNGYTTNKSGAALAVSGADTNVTIENVKFYSNELADTGSNSKNGAAIYQTGGELTITDSEFRENTFITLRPGWGGSAIALDTVKVTITGTHFIQNTALNNYSNDSGGALWINGSSDVTVTGGSFVQNSSDTIGGAVYIKGGALTVDGTLFEGNTAAKNGGAVYINGGALTVDGTLFEGNTAAKNGGAIYSNKGVTMSIYNAVFKGNYAGEYVDGVFTADGTQAGGAVFSQGTSTGDNGRMIITNTTFYDNKAAYGGAVCMQPDGNGLQMDVVNTTIAGNYATKMGGGLFIRETLSNQYPYLLNSIVLGNTSAAGDDDITYVADANGKNKIYSYYSIIGTVRHGGFGTLGSLTEPTVTTGDPVVNNGGSQIYAMYSYTDGAVTETILNENVTKSAIFGDTFTWNNELNTLAVNTDNALVNSGVQTALDGRYAVYRTSAADTWKRMSGNFSGTDPVLLNKGVSGVYQVGVYKEVEVDPMNYPIRISMFGNVEGATGTVDLVTLSQGSAEEFTSEYALAGWDFLGFSKDMGSATVDYAASYDAESGTCTLSAETVNELIEKGIYELYAVWSKDYTLSYHEAGQDVATKTVTVYNGQSGYTLTSTENPALTDVAGWEERGWSLNTEGFAVTDITTLTITSDMAFYAVYDRSVTATYKANGGTGDDVTVAGGTQYRNVDTVTAVTLTVATDDKGFTKSGYEFKGWSSTADGEVITDTTITVTPAADAAANADFYAVWLEKVNPVQLYTVSGDTETVVGSYETVQDAINAATTADTQYLIRFDARYFSLNKTDTLVLNAGLTIDTANVNITIDGLINDVNNNGVWDEGDTRVALDGADSYRILASSAEGLNLTLKNLTLRNGYVNLLNGGALYIDGTNADVTIDHVKFYGNNVADTNFAYAGGAAIYQKNGTLTITDSEFRENALTGVAQGNYGGAIKLDGVNAAITRTDFIQNTATSTQNASGGALYIYGASTVSITGGLFEGNSAANNAGAIDVEGTAVLSIKDVTFDGNHAKGSGGAVYIGSSAAKVNIDNTAFINNYAGEYVDGVFTASGTQAGGAIYNAGTASTDGCIISNSTFWNNKAAYGGALLILGGQNRIYNTTIAENHATTKGGGMYVYMNLVGTHTYLTNSIVLGNTVGKSAMDYDIGFAQNQTDKNSKRGIYSYYSMVGTVIHAGCGSDWTGTLPETDPKETPIVDKAGSLIGNMKSWVLNAENDVYELQTTEPVIQPESGDPIKVNSVISADTVFQKLTVADPANPGQTIQTIWNEDLNTVNMNFGNAYIKQGVITGLQTDKSGAYMLFGDDGQPTGTWLNFDGTALGTDVTVTALNEAKTANGETFALIGSYDGPIPKTATIQFEMNTGSLTGSGSMADLVITEGTDYTDLTTDYALEDWTFLGFSTNPNATSAAYTVTNGKYSLTAEQVNTLITDGVTTLYAIWSKDYSVTFQEAGTAARTETFTVYNGNTAGYTLSAADMTQTDLADWNEKGWSVSADSSAVTYANGAEATITDSLTLFAVYDRTVTLNYSLNYDGAPTVSDTASDTQIRVVNTADPVNLTVLSGDTFTREGYTFKGWSETETGTTAITAATVTVSGTDAASKTLYALWEVEAAVSQDHVYTVKAAAVGDTEFTTLSAAVNKALSVAEASPNDTFTINVEDASQLKFGQTLTTKINLTINGNNKKLDSGLLTIGADADGTSITLLNMAVGNESIHIKAYDVNITFRNVAIQNGNKTYYTEGGSVSCVTYDGAVISGMKNSPFGTGSAKTLIVKDTMVFDSVWETAFKVTEKAVIQNSVFSGNTFYGSNGFIAYDGEYVKDTTGIYIDNTKFFNNNGRFFQQGAGEITNTVISGGGNVGQLFEVTGTNGSLTIRNTVISDVTTTYKILNALGKPVTIENSTIVHNTAGESLFQNTGTGSNASNSIIGWNNGQGAGITADSSSYTNSAAINTTADLNNSGTLDSAQDREMYWFKDEYVIDKTVGGVRFTTGTGVDGATSVGTISYRNYLALSTSTATMNNDASTAKGAQSGNVVWVLTPTVEDQTATYGDFQGGTITAAAQTLTNSSGLEAKAVVSYTVAGTAGNAYLNAAAHTATVSVATTINGSAVTPDANGLITAGGKYFLVEAAETVNVTISRKAVTVTPEVSIAAVDGKYTITEGNPDGVTVNPTVTAAPDAPAPAAGDFKLVDAAGNTVTLADLAAGEYTLAYAWKTADDNYNPDFNTITLVVESAAPVSPIVVTATNDTAFDAAAVYVNGTGYDGVAGISLREALHAAVNGETITFSTALGSFTNDTNSTIKLDAALVLNKNITINGLAGGIKVTLDGQDKTRIVELTTNNTVTLRNLQFTGGKTDAYGGVIYQSNGELFIADSVFTGNIQSGSRCGSVLAMYTKGDCVITNSVFHNNTGSDWGGMLWTDRGFNGNLYLISSTVVANNDSGAFKIEGGTAYVLDSVIAGNSGTDVVQMNNGTIIVDSSIYGTTKGVINAGAAGANSVLTATGTAAIAEALGVGASAANNYAADADSLAATQHGRIQIARVTLTDGTQKFYYHIDSIRQNHWFTLDGSEEAALSKTDTATYGLSGLTNYQSMEWISDNQNPVYDDTVKTMNVTIAENLNVDAGTNYTVIAGVTDADSGDALTGYKVTYSKTMDGTFAESRPEYDDSGDYTLYYQITLDNYTTVRGSVAITINEFNEASGLAYTKTTDGVLTYYRSIQLAVNDVADGGTDGTVYVYGADIPVFSTISITESTFKNGTEKTITIQGIGDGAHVLDGGGVLIYDANGNPTGQEQNVPGIQILNIGSGVNVTIDGLTFTGGGVSAKTDGGAIVTAGNLTIINSVFTGNAGNLGGAIHQSGGILAIEGTVFKQNLAGSNTSQGAAIYSTGSSVCYIVDSYAYKNTASGWGGLFVTAGTAELYLFSSVVVDNQNVDSAVKVDKVESNIYVLNSVVVGNKNNSDFGGAGPVRLDASFYGSTSTSAGSDFTGAFESNTVLATGSNAEKIWAALGVGEYSDAGYAELAASGFKAMEGSAAYVMNENIQIAEVTDAGGATKIYYHVNGKGIDKWVSISDGTEVIASANSNEKFGLTAAAAGLTFVDWVKAGTPDIYEAGELVWTVSNGGAPATEYVYNGNAYTVSAAIKSNGQSVALTPAAGADTTLDPNGYTNAGTYNFVVSGVSDAGIITVDGIQYKLSNAEAQNYSFTVTPKAISVTPEVTGATLTDDGKYYASTAAALNITAAITADPATPAPDIVLVDADGNVITDVTALANGTHTLQYVVKDGPDANYNFSSSAFTVIVGSREDGSLVVTTTADKVDEYDGVTSLREAITLVNSDTAGTFKDANGKYTITFSSEKGFFTGAANSTIKLDSTLQITRGGENITINGLVSDANGNGVWNKDEIRAVLDGGTVYDSTTGAVTTAGVQILKITAGNQVTVAVKNLVFQNGYSATDGGAIYSGGGQRNTLTIDHCLFQNNTAVNGGAVYAADFHNGTFVVESSFLDNTAAGGSGGALNINKTLTLSGTNTFTGNKLIDLNASSLEKHYGAAFYTGLGVSISKNAVIKISGSDIDLASTNVEGLWGSYSSCGGFVAYVSGTLNMGTGSKLNISNSTVDLTRTTTGSTETAITVTGGLLRVGGAADLTGAELNLTKNTLNFNSVPAGETSNNIIAISGGLVRFDDALTLGNGSIVIGGTTAADGNKVTSVTSGHNQVNGGMLSVVKSMTMNNGTLRIMNNTVDLDVSADGSGCLQIWGGIMHLAGGSNHSFEQGDFVISGNTVDFAAANSNSYVRGGILSVTDKATGITVSFKGTAARHYQMKDNIITSSVTVEGGDFYLHELNDGQTRKLEMSYFDFTRTAGSAAAAAMNVKGGAININNRNSAELDHVLISGYHVTDNGGGIYSSGLKDLTLTDSVLKNNIADKDGGAINVKATAFMTIADCTFEGNQGLNGGAIRANNAPNLTITDTVFRNNTATVALGGNGQQGGGALYTTATTTSLENVLMLGNTATSGQGGAIYHWSSGGTLNIINSTIAQNSSGIHFYNNAPLIVLNSIVALNTTYDVKYHNFTPSTVPAFKNSLIGNVYYAATNMSNDSTYAPLEGNRIGTATFDDIYYVNGNQYLIKSTSAAATDGALVYRNADGTYTTDAGAGGTALTTDIDGVTRDGKVIGAHASVLIFVADTVTVEAATPDAEYGIYGTANSTVVKSAEFALNSTLNATFNLDYIFAADTAVSGSGFFHASDTEYTLEFAKIYFTADGYTVTAEATSVANQYVLTLTDSTTAAKLYFMVSTAQPWDSIGVRITPKKLLTSDLNVVSNNAALKYENGTFSKVYDGTKDQAAGDVTLSIGTGVAGDSLVITQTGAAFTGKDVSTENQKFTISGISLGNDNYMLVTAAGDTEAATSVTYAGSISAKKLTLSADMFGTTARDYNGDTDFKANTTFAWETGMLVGDDSLTLAYTATLNSKDAAASSTVTFGGFGITDSNYALANADATFTKTGELVTAKEVTLSWGTTSFVYNGKAQKPVATVASGLVTGESLNVAVSPDNNINVGSNYIATAMLKDNGTFLASNYRIAAGNETRAYEITANTDEIVVTITGNTLIGTYNGTEQSVSGYEVRSSNSLYTENDFTFSGTGVAKGTDAGTYNMNLNEADFMNTSSNFSNVKFVIAEDGKLTIKQAQATLSDFTIGNLIYNGGPVTTGDGNDIYVTASGVSGGAAPSGGITYTFYADDTYQTVISTPVNAGTYYVKAVLAGDNNYFGTEKTASFEIDRAAVTVTANAQTKVYGDADPALTYTATGLVGTDTLSGGLERVTGENAGAYAITQGTLTNENNANYAITFVGADLTITAKAITVTADAQTKVYGDADPALTYTATGLVGTDTLSGVLERTAGENVGEYAITLGTLANDNYAITFTGAKLTVTARPITVKADDIKIDTGKDPVFTYTYVGELVGNDAFTGDLASGGDGSKPGEFDITQGTLTLGGNYAITFIGGTLTVEGGGQDANQFPNYSNPGNSSGMYKDNVNSTDGSSYDHHDNVPTLTHQDERSTGFLFSVSNRLTGTVPGMSGSMAPLGADVDIHAHTLSDLLRSYDKSEQIIASPANTVEDAPNDMKDLDDFSNNPFDILPDDEDLHTRAYGDGISFTVIGEDNLSAVKADAQDASSPSISLSAVLSGDSFELYHNEVVAEEAVAEADDDLDLTGLTEIVSAVRSGIFRSDFDEALDELLAVAEG